MLCFRERTSGSCLDRISGREKLGPLDSLPSHLYPPRLLGVTSRKCLNLFVVVLEVVRLNSSGLTSQQTKTERFVVPSSLDRKPVINSSPLTAGRAELPGSQHQRANGSLAKEQGCSLVR